MKFIVTVLTDKAKFKAGETLDWNGLHIEAVEETTKINREQFGDWLRNQRQKYGESFKVDKVNIWVI